MGGIEQHRSFKTCTSSETHIPPMNSETTFSDLSTTGSTPSTKQILQTIINDLDAFEQRIADSELKLEGSKEIGRRIEGALNRQLMDGLISYSEFSNLNHVKELWISTSATFATYNLGCKSSKRLIVSNLIDLFTLNEISRERLLDIATEI